jgi:predicted RNase H-like HicB family nuclease
VTVPALPGCVTQGETLEEAIAMAKDAIRLYIDTLIAGGVPVPEEREPPQAYGLLDYSQSSTRFLSPM